MITVKCDKCGKHVEVEDMDRYPTGFETVYREDLDRIEPPSADLCPECLVLFRQAREKAQEELLEIMRYWWTN